MEINYNEIFDIETAETVQTGDTETEAAAQEQTQEQPTDGTPAEEAPENASQEAEKKEQTPEERARQAMGRRIRESEERARQAERERINATLKRLGITNPTTNEAIETVDELEAYEKGLRDTRLKEGRANDGDIREVVREEIARASEPEKSAETPPPSLQRDPRIEAELAEIKRLDPDFADVPTEKLLGEILRGEYGPQFRRLVDAGESFIEAFKYVARDKLDKQRADRAAEAARVQAASKDHLSSTKPQGVGAVTVPKDVEAEFRVFFPDASAAEIQRMYAADLKKMKR